MSASRKDFEEIETLLVNDKRGRTQVITAVQSATIGENAPSIQLYATGSSDIVQFLPAEATNQGKEIEFFVTGTSSALLILKNTSGDRIVLVAPGGYGKAVNIRGVWYGAAGGTVGTLSAPNLGSAAVPTFGSGASAIGFSSVTEANAFAALVNKMRDLMQAHGWAI